ncbi:MAG TPA: phage tail tape measure protein [Streptosporangiaceae bacterium]|nr:phage tail tape measure protein [Streptosporangiaceae bacterium]
MPVLPPLTQTIGINAEEFLAGIDQMVAAAREAATAINEAAEATARMSEAAGYTSDVETRLFDIENAVADGADRIVGAMEAATTAIGEVTTAVEANTTAVEENAAAMDANAASSDKAAAASAGFAARSKLAFVAVAAALAYAVVKGAEFQDQVVRLYAAAGLAHAAYSKVTAEILRIGDATGQTGTAIAQALYHPISAGLSLASSLKVVSYAAQLAAIHGADLEDTTYALSSVMKAYNISTGQAGRAAALLNAIVGEGDMRFQDFNESIKNWTPTMSQLGISIQSAGAAIAYLTDRGNTAEVAATRVSMGLTMLTSGSKEANTILGALGLTTGNLALKNETLAQVMKKYGITSTTLAKDLQQPDGIYVALTKLRSALEKAGVSGSQASALMAKLFGGGRSDKAIVSLMENLDGLRSKYNKITGDVKNYGAAWAKTQQTVAFEWHRVTAEVRNLAISFGEVLLPAVQRVLTALGSALAFLQKNPVIAAFAGALIAVGVAFKIAASAAALFSAAVDANPVMLAIMAVIALGVALYELWQHCKTVRDAVADVGKFFVTGWRDALKGAGEIIKWFDSGPMVWIHQQIAVFQKFWAKNHKEIEQIASNAWALIKDIIIPTWETIWAIVKSVFDVAVGVFKATWAVIIGVLKITWTVIETVVSTAIKVVLDVISATLDIIQGHWSAAGKDLQDATGAIWHGVVRIIKSVTSDFGSMLVSAGKDLVSGLMNGIRSMIGSLQSEAANMAGSVLHSVLHVFDSHSPSRKMYQIGVWVTQGLALGIGETARQVTAVARKLAADVTRALAAGEITGSQAAGLDTRIRDGLDRDLRDIKRRRAEYVKELHDIGLEMKAGLLRGLTSRSTGTINSSVSKLVTIVKEAFNAGAIGDEKANWLTSWLEGDNRKLDRLANQRNAILKKISEARKYASATKSNIISYASLSNIASAIPDGGAVTGGALLAGLRQDLSQIRKFNDAIRKLAKLGLNKNLLNQIIQAGPADGLAMAEALLDGPVSQIRQLNKTETQITTAAGQLGKTAAEAMYDTGKYAGKGFLAGLEAQRKAIEQLMDKIAKSMIAVLRKELGIGSKSSGGHKHGRKFAQDIADGIKDGASLVDDAVRNLARGAIFRPRGLGALAAGGSVNVYYQVDVHIPFGYVGNIEELAHALGPVVQKALLQLQEKNPINVLGKRH